MERDTPSPSQGREYPGELLDGLIWLDTDGQNPAHYFTYCSSEYRPALRWTAKELLTKLKEAVLELEATLAP
jgi:hypothetical protein